MPSSTLLILPCATEPTRDVTPFFRMYCPFVKLVCLSLSFFLFSSLSPLSSFLIFSLWRLTFCFSFVFLYFCSTPIFRVRNLRGMHWSPPCRRSILNSSSSSLLFLFFFFLFFFSLFFDFHLDISASSRRGRRGDHPARRWLSIRMRILQVPLQAQGKNKKQNIQKNKKTKQYSKMWSYDIILIFFCISFFLSFFLSSPSQGYMDAEALVLRKLSDSRFLCRMYRNLFFFFFFFFFLLPSSFFLLLPSSSFTFFWRLTLYY